MSSHGHGAVNTNSTLNSIWIVDDYIIDIFRIFSFSVLGTLICFFGTIANAINMVVFFKHGFMDTINISFFGLAISDGGCLLTHLWVSISETPQLEWLISSVSIAEIAYVSGAIPYLCFTRISALITTYITFERCLCIAFPLKVKSILTSTRTTCIIVSLFLIMFSVTIPAFTVNKIEWYFVAEKNTTILGDSFAPNREEVENVVYAFNNLFGYFSFISIIICTAVLATILHHKATWRRRSTAVDLSSCTVRDRKVIAMVVTISTVFIICYFPKTILYFAIMVDNEFDMHGVYHNLILMIISLAFCMETFSCSMNIFIYRSMSTKYKQTLEAMFPTLPCSGNNMKKINTK